MGTSGISSPFELLSRSSGQVAYVLLDRSPLGSEPKLLPPLDLHVAGTPLAFALSQDQTLHRKSITTAPKGRALRWRKVFAWHDLKASFPLPSFQGATVSSIAPNNIHQPRAICQRFPQDFQGNFSLRGGASPPRPANQYYTTAFAICTPTPKIFFCRISGYLHNIVKANPRIRRAAPL